MLGTARWLRRLKWNAGWLIFKSKLTKKKFKKFKRRMRKDRKKVVEEKNLIFFFRNWKTKEDFILECNFKLDFNRIFLISNTFRNENEK